MDERSLNNLIIPGWMVFEMKLNYSELRVYALIYGFSQSGQGEFYGSWQYLADWCGIARNYVPEVLKSLQQKGLLLRRTDMVVGKHGKPHKVVHYQAVIPDELRKKLCSILLKMRGKKIL